MFVPGAGFAVENCRTPNDIIIEQRVEAVHVAERNILQAPVDLDGDEKIFEWVVRDEKTSPFESTEYH